MKKVEVGNSPTKLRQLWTERSNVVENKPRGPDYFGPKLSPKSLNSPRLPGKEESAVYYI